MYSINGVALTNATYGWRLRASSNILSSYARQVVSLSVPGRDGVLTLPVQPTEAPVIAVKVMTPGGAARERLVLLMSQPGLVLAKLSDATKQVAVEFLSSDNESFDSSERVVEITFMLRLNDVFWRDVSVGTDAPVALSAASIVTSSMVGLSAPINDAVIRVAGGTTGLRVTDSQGDYFEYLPSIPVGSYLIFDCATGRATVVASNVWTGGTPVLVTNGPGPRFLQLSPVYGTTYSAALTVITATRTTSPTIEVRARRAFNA